MSVELPPGPWTTHDAGRVLHGRLLDCWDADGERVDLCDPDILRAIEALPGLVAAAREVLELHEAGMLTATGIGELPGSEGPRWYEIPRRFVALRRILARIDGPGGAPPAGGDRP